jgi:alkylation response protein AidB-like acyl-CoA dehydrogenase
MTQRQRRSLGVSYWLIFCYLDDGISMVIVDRDNGGYESRELRKMGLVDASTCELFFDRAETT